MEAESIIHEKGTVAVIVQKDALTREEKDTIRAALPETEGLMSVADVYVLLIEEAPTPDTEETESEPEETEPEVVMPTLSDLEGMTVVQLRDLAARKDADISGLSLKADIVGRLAAHFDIEV